MSVKTALRKLSRAFAAKDADSFDEALGELEEKMEDAEPKDPDTIEVHNHIPDGAHFDTALGEMPPRTGGDRRSRDESEEGGDEPPWFKKHREANDATLKKMNDSIENLMKGKEKEPGEEGEDSRPRDEDPSEELSPGETDPNLEMDRLWDRRDRHAPNDEANKEILGELEFEAPPGTGDRARRAKDSVLLEDAFQDALAKAEVIAPGIRLPAFDAKLAPAKTVGKLVQLRRTALDLAYNQPATRGVIEQAIGGRTLDSKRMSIGAARVLFNAVAGQVGQGNNQRATDRSGTFEPGGGARTSGAAIQSLADINRVNRERSARK